MTNAWNRSSLAQVAPQNAVPSVGKRSSALLWSAFTCPTALSKGPEQKLAGRLLSQRPRPFRFTKERLLRVSWSLCGALSIADELVSRARRTWPSRAQRTHLQAPQLCNERRRAPHLHCLARHQPDLGGVLQNAIQATLLLASRPPSTSSG